MNSPKEVTTPKLNHTHIAAAKVGAGSLWKFGAYLMLVFRDPQFQDGALTYTASGHLLSHYFEMSGQTMDQTKTVGITV